MNNINQVTVVYHDPYIDSFKQLITRVKRTISKKNLIQKETIKIRIEHQESYSNGIREQDQGFITKTHIQYQSLRISTNA